MNYSCGPWIRKAPNTMTIHDWEEKPIIQIMRECRSYPEYPSDGLAEANARLVVEAPMMQYNLELALAELESFEGELDGMGHPYELPYFVKEIRAQLQRIKGES